MDEVGSIGPLYPAHALLKVFPDPVSNYFCLCRPALRLRLSHFRGAGACLAPFLDALLPAKGAACCGYGWPCKRMFVSPIVFRFARLQPSR